MRRNSLRNCHVLFSRIRWLSRICLSFVHSSLASCHRRFLIAVIVASLCSDLFPATHALTRPHATPIASNHTCSLAHPLTHRPLTPQHVLVLTPRHLHLFALDGMPSAASVIDAPARSIALVAIDGMVVATQARREVQGRVGQHFISRPKLDEFCCTILIFLVFSLNAQCTKTKSQNFQNTSTTFGLFLSFGFTLRCQFSFHSCLTLM